MLVMVKVRPPPTIVPVSSLHISNFNFHLLDLCVVSMHSTYLKMSFSRDASGGSFLTVTCGNGHIALAGPINSFWCRIVWDSVIVNLSLWEIMSC